MKKLTVFATAMLAIVAAKASTVIWEWDGNIGTLPDSTPGLTLVSDVNGDSSNGNAIFYNAKTSGRSEINVAPALGTDWTAYDGKKWTFSYDAYITAADLKNTAISYDLLHFKRNGTPGGLGSTQIGSLTPDTWNKITYSGTFSNEKEDTSRGFKFYIFGEPGGQPDAMTGGDSGYHLDNMNLAVIPEPATLSLFGLISGSMFVIRRRFIG